MEKDQLRRGIEMEALLKEKHKAFDDVLSAKKIGSPAKVSVAGIEILLTPNETEALLKTVSDRLINETAELDRQFVAL